MKLNKALTTVNKCLGDDDIAIFSGKELCVLAAKFNRKNVLYLNSTKAALAITTGIANAVENRVVFFCTADTLIGELSTAAQAAASKCFNLFVVVFDSGKCLYTGTPSISSAVKNP